MTKSKNNSFKILTWPVQQILLQSPPEEVFWRKKNPRTITIPLQGNEMHKIYMHSFWVITFVKFDPGIIFSLLVLSYGRSCSSAGTCFFLFKRSSECSWGQKKLEIDRNHFLFLATMMTRPMTRITTTAIVIGIHIGWPCGWWSPMNAVWLELKLGDLVWL